jgi:hypothetical protein
LLNPLAETTTIRPLGGSHVFGLTISYSSRRVATSCSTSFSPPPSSSPSSSSLTGAGAPLAAQVLHDYPQHQAPPLHLPLPPPPALHLVFASFAVPRHRKVHRACRGRHRSPRQTPRRRDSNRRCWKRARQGWPAHLLATTTGPLGTPRATSGPRPGAIPPRGGQCSGCLRRGTSSW